MKNSFKSISGLLLLDKPLGISSNQALTKVKRLFNTAKVGHTGTLDPAASGLLPVCLGEATKFASYLLEGDKEYIAQIRLGVVTSTGDNEGEVLACNSVAITTEQIAAIATRFCGEIEQIPPMYSALKHNGQPLYRYARAGITIQRPARKITIYELEVLNYNQSIQELSLRVIASKGTYIRTLAEDIGEFLKCGASLAGLRRTKTNSFNLNEAYSLEELEHKKALGGLNLALLPVATLTRDLPKLLLTPKEFQIISFGNILYLDQVYPGLKFGSTVNLFAADVFLGVACYGAENDRAVLRPKRLISGLLEIKPWP
jgi:tRNA pseudouridine55 synthase